MADQKQTNFICQSLAAVATQCGSRHRPLGRGILYETNSSSLKFSLFYTLNAHYAVMHARLQCSHLFSLSVFFFLLNFSICLHLFLGLRWRCICCCWRLSRTVKKYLWKACKMHAPFFFLCFFFSVDCSAESYLYLSVRLG